jgi:hypothetical protein
MNYKIITLTKKSPNEWKKTQKPKKWKKKKKMENDEKRRRKNNAPFVCELQPPISNLHMARRGGELPC